MAISPEQFQNNLDKALELTADDMVPVMQEAALSAKALLVRRIREIGFGKNYKQGPYKELRRRKGYEVKFVNLSFTNEMLNGWNIPRAEKDGLKIRGLVGGSTAAVRDKLKWNKSRYPKFDDLNKEEKELVKEALIMPRLKQILSKHLFKQ